MDIFAIPSSAGRGNFRLLTELSAAQLDLVTLREDLAVDDTEPPPGSPVIDADLHGDRDEHSPARFAEENDDTMVRTAEEVEFGCWWFEEYGCEGLVSCHCGPATLLEVVTHTSEVDRPAVIAAHMSRMSELWAHYWSGDALLTGTAPDFSDTCASCIIEGLFHVGAVYEGASNMAQELGEAVAAFHSEVHLGRARWGE